MGRATAAHQHSNVLVTHRSKPLLGLRVCHNSLHPLLSCKFTNTIASCALKCTSHYKQIASRGCATALRNMLDFVRNGQLLELFCDRRSQSAEF
jgi:hypothetical protein